MNCIHLYLNEFQCQYINIIQPYTVCLQCVFIYEGLFDPKDISLNHIYRGCLRQVHNSTCFYNIFFHFFFLHPATWPIEIIFRQAIFYSVNMYMWILKWYLTSEHIYYCWWCARGRKKKRYIRFRCGEALRKIFLSEKFFSPHIPHDEMLIWSARKSTRAGPRLRIFVYTWVSCGIFMHLCICILTNIHLLRHCIFPYFKYYCTVAHMLMIS